MGAVDICRCTMTMEYKTIIILTLFCTSTYGQFQQECVPLSQCEQIQWIQEHRESVPQLNFNELSCGFGNGEPNVWCEFNTIQGVQPHALMGSQRISSRCTGFLKVHFVTPESKLRILPLRRSLRRIVKRQFYRVSVIGNCCWKIYDNRYFTGSHQHLTQGFDDAPNFQFSSAKIVDCLPIN